MNRDGLIKIGITIIFFIVLFKKISINELMNAIASINLYYFLLSILLVPLLYIIRTYRWSILLKSVEINRPFIELLRVLIIGVFYGLITPGRIGEMARAYYLDEKKSVTLSTILMEKLIDILSLTILSCLTLIFFFHEYTLLSYTIIVGALAAVLSIYLFINKDLIAIFVKPLKIKYNDVQRYTDSFLKLRRDRGALIKTITLAFIYYFINYILAILILYSFGAKTFAVVTLPLIILMGNFPITLSGLGVRESIAAICFVLVGESGSNGVLFSLLLFLTITLMPGIIGYLLLLRKGKCVFMNQHRNVVK